MKFFRLIFLVPFIGISQIQSISNQKTIGTDFEEVASKTKVYNGFIYSLITPQNPAISQDKLVAGFGGLDAWFVKMDFNFNILEQYVYGGTMLDVGVDFVPCNNGDFILLINSWSGADGNKTLPNFSVGSIPSSDYWVVRINSTGNILWQKEFGGTESDSPVRILKISEDRYFIGGESFSQVSGNKTIPNFGQGNLWSIFIDGQGNELDQKVFGGVDGEVFVNARLNTDSTKLVFGFYSYSGISGSKTVPLTGGIDGWVFTTDTLGNIIDQKGYSQGVNTNTYLRDIQFDNNNNVFVALEGDQGISGDKTEAGFGATDAWIVKLSSNLTEIDQYVYGGTSGDGVYRMFRDGNNVILCLASQSSADGNKTEPAFGGIDNWLVCIDPNGNILWQKSAGGNLHEGFFTVNKLAENEYVVVSQTLSDVSGNKTVPLYVSGVSDLWFYKLTTTLSVQKTEISDQFQVAPNPFVDEILFSWDQSSQDIGIEIFNSTGHRIEWIQDLEGSTFQWSAHNLPKGVYYYTCTSNRGVSKGKIVKQ